MVQSYQIAVVFCICSLNGRCIRMNELFKITNSDANSCSAFLKSAFHFNNINQLIKQGAELLNNPIAVFDAHYYTVAYSNTHDIQDEVWLGGKERGYCLFEYAAMLSGLDNIQEYSIPFRIFDDFGPHRRRISPLISNSITIGYLTVLEYWNDLDAVPLDLYDLVVGVITKELAVEQAIRQNHQSDSAEFLLTSLLNKEFANRLLFEQRMLGTEFEQSREYRLLSINMAEFQSKTTGEGHFKAQLSALFPKAWTAFHNQYAVVLVDCGNYRLSDDWEIRVSDCLRQYGLFAGCSDVFSDLYNIREHYSSAIIAEALARKLRHTTLIAQYDAYKLWTMAYRIKPEERAQYLSTALMQLQQYDRESGSEYVETLFAYLNSGERLEKTAQRLHVHRNTVVYRIEKMKERFGMSFDSTYCNFQNYIGCMLLALSQIETNEASIKVPNEKRQ